MLAFGVGTVPSSATSVSTYSGTYSRGTRTYTDPAYSTGDVGAWTGTKIHIAFSADPEDGYGFDVTGESFGRWNGAGFIAFRSTSPIVWYSHTDSGGQQLHTNTCGSLVFGGRADGIVYGRLVDCTGFWFTQPQYVTLRFPSGGVVTMTFTRR